MAASADTPQLQADVSSWSTTVTTANTARDGTGTLATIHTAPSDGSYLYGIRFASMGPNQPTLANIFIYNGATYFLERQVELPEITTSETEADPEIFIQFGKKVRAGDVISFAICRSVASGWRAKAVADGYTAVL